MNVLIACEESQQNISGHRQSNGRTMGVNRMDDLISRQAAIDAVGVNTWAGARIMQLPPAQPDGIPLEWIDKHLEWLDNCDNDFAQLAKVSIKAMVELWKKDRI